MPFELTQARAFLRRYMKEIHDLLTTEEDLKRYESFNEKLKELAQTTELFYNNNYPMASEIRPMLLTKYEAALTAAAEVLEQRDTGPVGIRLRSVVRELTPLLTMDFYALNLMERDETLLEQIPTVSEFFGKARTQAADLGDEPGPVGDAPMLLRVQGPNGFETGVFTPLKPDLELEQATAYSLMGGLLGGSDLVTKARPMLLSHATGRTAGAFISRADGADPKLAGPGDPLLSFRAQNLDTLPAVSGLASMQLLDFLWGMEPRGPEHCALRFNPPYGPGARLTGLTVRADGIRFGSEPLRMDRLQNLTVIPAAFYQELASEYFENHLRTALRHCKLPAGAFERILERRNALVSKVEADRQYFADKAPGYTEAGRLRLVPEDQWNAYRLENLAQAAPDSAFAALLRLPQRTAERIRTERNQNLAQAPAPAMEALPRIPVARIIGNGLRQEPDPLNLNRPETIQLHIPPLSKDSALHGGLNARYPIQWTEDGKLRQGMFTLPRVHSVRAVIPELFAPYLADPNYTELRPFFLALQDYCSVSDRETVLRSLPTSVNGVPWKELGFSEEQEAALRNNQKLINALMYLGQDYRKQMNILLMEDRLGTARGQRIDLRNVAMSEVGDVLGVPKLLARSTTARAEVDGQIVDGIFMDTAEGVDLRNAEPGTRLTRITAEQAKKVYNTEGLKDLADLQILDYICLNQDRHQKNMFYRFQNLDSDNPIFLGVQGIDNDFSFGVKIPAVDQQYNRLPPLNSIKLISETMAAKLREPGLMEQIAEKMRRNGLSEESIQAARKRLELVQNRLKSKKMKIVRNGQWGKGNYTLEKLADQGRIFHNFKATVDQFAAQAKEIPLPPGQYVPMKEIRYQDAKPVKDFSESTKNIFRQRKLEEEAAEKLTGFAQEAADAPSPDGNPEHEALYSIVRELRKAMNQLEAGKLPWPWGSPQYRAMHEACRNALEFSEAVAQEIREKPNLEISLDDSKTLREKLNTLADRSAAFRSYKADDLKRHSRGWSTEAREAAAELCAKATAGAAEAYLGKRKLRQQPMTLIREQLRATQACLSGMEGALLRKTAAEILYYNGMTRLDLSHKIDGGGIFRAMKGNMIEKQTAKIMQEPAFQRLAALPDEELRALAAGKEGSALANRFIREIAHVQQVREAASPAVAPPDLLKPKPAQQNVDVPQQGPKLQLPN